MEQQSVASSKYAAVIIGILIFSGLYLASLYSYLLFHSLAEMFSIVVAVGIFMVAWNSRSFLDNNYLLFLGIAYIFIGGVDLIHTLAYKGMGVFEGYGTDLPTRLWISARYLESLSLFAAPLFLGRRLDTKPLLVSYLAAVSLLLGSIFYWNIFPVCFVEGVGLTPFKRISEYVVSLILLGSVWMLARRREDFEPFVFRLIVASIVATIAAELAFTFYSHAYGISNLVGHYFKIISFYLIYKAMIETGLGKPYTLLFRNLKRSEEALRKERDRAQSYLDIAGVIMVVLNPDQTVSLINRKGAEILGYPVKDIIGENWFDKCIPERHRERVKADFGKLVSGGCEPIEYFVNPVLTHEGEERIIAWHHTLLKDEGGRVIATLSSGEDITERKKAKEALQESEEKFRLMAESSTDLIYQMDPQGVITYCSPAVEKMTGYTLDEVVDTRFENFFPSSDIPKAVDAFQSVIAGERVDLLELKLQRKDGGVVPIEVNAVPSCKGGEIVGVQGIARDITLRKEAEEALRKAHEELEKRVEERTAELSEANMRLREEVVERKRAEETIKAERQRLFSVLDGLPAFVYLQAEDHSIRFANRYFKDHFGPYEGKKCYEVLWERDDPCMICPTFTVFEEGKTQEWECTELRDGLMYQIHDYPFTDMDGSQLVLELGFDITARKRAEEELRRLSAMILDAHEEERKRIGQELHDGLAQTMSAIKIWVEAAHMQMGQGNLTGLANSLGTAVPLAQGAVEEVRRISRNLRPSILDDLGILATISWLCKEFETTYSEISFEKQIQLEERDVPERLKIVIFRIIQEAFNNISKHSEADSALVGLKKWNGEIELTINDNGKGFDSEQVFYSEKSTGGLGLASMIERTELSGGSFSIESAKGAGTTLRASWAAAQDSKGRPQ